MSHSCFIYSGTSDNEHSEEWTTSLQRTNCSPPAYIYCPCISTSEEGTTSEQWTKRSSPTCPLERSIQRFHCGIHTWRVELNVKCHHFYIGIPDLVAEHQRKINTERVWQMFVKNINVGLGASNVGTYRSSKGSVTKTYKEKAERL